MFVSPKFEFSICRHIVKFDIRNMTGKRMATRVASDEYYEKNTVVCYLMIARKYTVQLRLSVLYHLSCLCLLDRLPPLSRYTSLY